MNNSREHVVALVLAMVALVVLPVSAILILAYPAGQDARAWEFLSGAVVGLGAPILGLVILKKQPHNRIGWLWLVIGLVIAYSSLTQGLKYRANSYPPYGYTSLVFSLLIFSETAYIIRFVCMMLMMLWFPNGEPPTPRWRFLHGWAVLSFILLIVELFAEKVRWSSFEGIVSEAPLVDNPIGFLPLTLRPIYELLAPIGFLSIVGMSLLAVLAMLLRYKSAGQQVRAQILWFVVGGVIYAASFIISLFLLDYSEILPGILTNLAILPFYLAIGIAITRYRLYDIDVIIRRTLQYSLLTGLLALVYFGSVLLGQRIAGAVTGEPDSTMVLVVSTLLVAALFNPLRARVQAFIDRRFFRQKYDAIQTLAAFTQTARDETRLEVLTPALVEVVQDSMQPEQVWLWLKR